MKLQKKMLKELNSRKNHEIGLQRKKHLKHGKFVKLIYKKKERQQKIISRFHGKTYGKIEVGAR